jgi:hypothetical protein
MALWVACCRPPPRASLNGHTPRSLYLDNAITPVSFPVLPLGGGRWLTRTTDRDGRRRSRGRRFSLVLCARAAQRGADTSTNGRRPASVGRGRPGLGGTQCAASYGDGRFVGPFASLSLSVGEFRAVNCGCMDGLNPCRYGRDTAASSLAHLTERSSESKPPGNL